MNDTDIETKTEPETALLESAAAKAPTGPDAAPVDDEPKAAGPTTLHRLRGIARRIAVPATVVAAVAGLLTAGFLGWKLDEKSDTDAAAEAGLAAARAYAVTLTSVDSNHLDRDFAAVLDGSTGEFKDMYTRSSGQLRQLLLENKATGTGTVLDAAVKSKSETKVEVLLFIDQTVTNIAAADPRVDHSRVQMTMELVDGRWLASRVYLP
jgi:Mce-associated membrane protein